VIAHIVLFQPKKSASAHDRQRFLKTIRAVTQSIPFVTSAKVGSIQSIGGLPNIAAGTSSYSLGAVLEFASDADLQAYLAHPRHDELKTIFWELCESTLIVDLQLVDVQSSLADDLI
jgi:hypothetical protein